MDLYAEYESENSRSKDIQLFFLFDKGNRVYEHHVFPWVVLMRVMVVVV